MRGTSTSTFVALFVALLVVLAGFPGATTAVTVGGAGGTGGAVTATAASAVTATAASAVTPAATTDAPSHDGAVAQGPERVTAQPGVTASVSVQCSFPYTATDATGTEVTVESEPQRLVVTQASAAQVAWDVGAKAKVVGMPVRSYTSYLDGSSERTDVLSEDGFSLDTETIVSLDPDLVLVPNASYEADPAAVERLRDAGLTVYVFAQDKTITGIYDKVGLVGRLTGECAGAETTVNRMRSQVETIRDAVQGEERPRVLYTFYNYTAGNGTFIHEVIRAAGGQNVAAQAGISGYKKISRETVAARNPQWVVIPSDASYPTGPAYEGTAAYQQGNRITVDASLMNQAGPRVVIPMTKLAKAWHPEAYAQANATAATATTTTAGSGGATTTAATATTTAATTTADTTTAATGPGFGVVASLLALAGAVLLARRD